LKVRVKEARIMHVGIPFKKKFKHALKVRGSSDSVFVKLELDDGTVGYGESLPRIYVTGETPHSVIEGLKSVIQHKVLRYGIESYRELPSFISGLEIEKNAVKCALELALMDAYGKYFEDSVCSLIGNRVNDSISYSGVMSAGSVLSAVKKSILFKAFGFKFVKIKVGLPNDMARLRAARNILGDDVNIRVDANCAWTVREAIENITKMRKFNISMVEQPVKAGDYYELKMVTDAVPIAISADESLCTVDDAQRLADLKACNIFNIRISKCGGLMNAVRIADIARRNKIGLQLGCQVGESGVISAAGWHFARVTPDISFYEGAYGRFLLKEDLTKEDMTFKRGGILGDVSGSGLGVTVRENILEKYTLSKHILS